MMYRLMLLSVGLCLFAGCEPARQEANAPSPPEFVVEPTGSGGGNRDPEAPATYQVRLETTKGPIVIDVERELAPRGADRFYRLVNEGYYDEAKFFRVVEDFVVQFGMAADPELNAQWDDATIRDDPVRDTNARGTVTFATSGPDSRTTQIFINLGNNSRLDGMGFAPFGRVSQGMDVVEQLNNEYGEAPQQGRIAAQGNAYLEAEFPNLDGIESARIVSENGQPAETETTTAETEDSDASEAEASTEADG